MITYIIVFGLLGTLAGSEWTIARFLSSKEKGGKFNRSLTWVPEFVMALIAGTLTCEIYGWNETFTHFLINCAMIGYYYAWIQTGRHDALDVGSEKGRPIRDNTLTVISLYISSIFKWHRDSLQYDLTFWAVMGLMLTLPLGGVWGLIGMPLGCYIAVKTKDKIKLNFSKYDWHFTRAFLMYGFSLGGSIWLVKEIF